MWRACVAWWELIWSVLEGQPMTTSARSIVQSFGCAPAECMSIVSARGMGNEWDVKRLYQRVSADGQMFATGSC